MQAALRVPAGAPVPMEDEEAARAAAWAGAAAAAPAEADRAQGASQPPLLHTLRLPHRLTSPAMPADAGVSEPAPPAAPSPGPWQQTAHGKGRVRPRKNAPPGADVPRLAAVAHRCAAAAAARGLLPSFPWLITPACSCPDVCGRASLNACLPCLQRCGARRAGRPAAALRRAAGRRLGGLPADGHPSKRVCSPGQAAGAPAGAAAGHAAGGRPGGPLDVCAPGGLGVGNIAKGVGSAMGDGDGGCTCIICVSQAVPRETRWSSPSWRPLPAPLPPLRCRRRRLAASARCACCARTPGATASSSATRPKTCTEGEEELPIREVAGAG